MAWEDMMRGFAFTVTAVAAVLGSALPAQAAWHYFGCPADNFASQFPDVPKMESILFSMERHGKALSARTYTTNVDNIVYRMLVADYSDRVPDGASILGEAMFQYVGDERRGIRNGKIITNDVARIEGVDKGATYGRRITMDMSNGAGRNLTTFYFRDGKLYEQSVTVLSANGDYSSPNGSRFVESLRFNLSLLDGEANGKPTYIDGCGSEIKPFTYK